MGWGLLNVSMSAKGKYEVMGWEFGVCPGWLGAVGWGLINVKGSVKVNLR